MNNTKWRKLTSFRAGIVVGSGIYVLFFFLVRERGAGH